MHYIGQTPITGIAAVFRDFIPEDGDGPPSTVAFRHDAVAEVAVRLIAHFIANVHFTNAILIQIAAPTTGGSVDRIATERRHRYRYKRSSSATGSVTISSCVCLSIKDVECSVY